MKKKKPLTAQETLTMKCIWSAKEEPSLSNIYQRAVEYYRQDWEYQTISVFLESLVQKGFIVQKKENDKVLYNPLISEEDYKTQQTKEFIAFCNKKPFFCMPAGFKEKKGMTREEYEKIRRTLEELDD